MEIGHVYKCSEALFASLKEELQDVIKYSNMYDNLMKQGYYDEADEIEEIAREEFTHAEAIYDILDDWGYDLSSNEELLAMWKNAELAFKHH